MAFNINAQVILSGPKNIRAVTKRIKSELSSVSVPVNIKIDKSTSKNLSGFNRGVKELTTNLNNLRTSSTSADVSIRKLVAGLGTLSSISTKVSSAQAKVGSAAKRTGQEIAVARNELQEFGKDAALAIRRFTAFTVATTVVFGFVRAIGKATGAALEYEREIVKIVQVTGAGASKIGQLKSTIDDLSVSLGVDANELASLSRIFAQTGQSIDQVRASIRSVARASLAPSFGEMKGTAEGLIAAMAQFNIAADQSEQVLGALNAVSKKFAVESEDLISVIRRAGGVFSTSAGQMKEPQQALNELIGLFTAVRSTTRESADTIATGLRTIFTRIQRRGTIEFLRQFNIELLDAQGNFVGLFPAFQKLSAGLKGLVQSGDAVKLSAITEELGGIRQVGKLIPTIVNFNKALAATKIAAQGAAEGLGKDVNLALQPLGKQFEQLGSRFNSLIRTISESKTFQNLAKVAISTANAFLSVAETLTPLIPLITTLATIKITRGLFQFGQGFVGGLKKGRGVESAGGTVGTFVGGGGGAAPAPKPSGGEKILAAAIRENVTSIRLNTTSVNKVAGILTQSSVKFTTSATNLITSNVNLVVSIGNLIGALNRNVANRGLGGGFRPTKFARGGVVRGPSHAQGGVLAELEGGERVIPRGYTHGSPGSVRQLLAEERADPQFSGFTQGRKKKRIGILGDQGIKISRVEKKLLARLKNIPDDGSIETFGGAFLSSPGPVAGKLKGSVNEKEIEKALSRTPIYAALKGITPTKGGGGKLASLKRNIAAAAAAKKDFTLLPEVLTGTKGEEIENIILEQVENAIQQGARQLALSTRIQGSGGQAELVKILRGTNIDNVIGNVFEAIITNAGVPYSQQDNDSPNAPFDFPLGLKDVAPNFGRGRLTNVKSDAKTRYTSENIGSFLVKARDSEADRLEQALLDALSGPEAAELLAGFPGSESGLKQRGVTTAILSRRKGTELRAAGGPIFSPRGTDTVPAMLTPGEYVINRKSAQSIGYGQLDNMNRLAAGGKVHYLSHGSGGRTGPTGTVATTQRGEGLEGATGTLVDKFGMAAVAVTGMTAAISGLDFSSLDSALISAGSLALTFAQLQFFLGAGTFKNLGGLLGKIPGLGQAGSDLRGAAGIGRKTFEKARTGRTIRGAFLPGVNSAASGRALGGGFKGFFMSARKGLGAFTKSLGTASGLVKGFGGLLIAAIADPIIDKGIDAIFGKIIEVAPGIRGRKGLSESDAARAGGAAGAAKGALTGAAIASLIPIPVISTAIGAAVGAVVGGILGAMDAAEDQRVFNTFIKLEKSGNKLAKSFELIEKSAGFLGRDEQAVFQANIRGFTKHLDGASTRLSDFAEDLEPPGFFDLGGGGETRRGRTGRSFAEGWRSFLGFGGYGEEGEGLKSVEERGAFLGSPQIKERIEKGKQRLDQNAAALAQTALDVATAQTLASIKVPELSEEVRRGAALITVPQSDVSMEVFRREGMAGQGALDIARTQDALAGFKKVNDELKRLEGTGNVAAESLRRVGDKRLYLDIVQNVEDQSKAFGKVNEEVKRGALEVGFGLLRKEIDLTKISEGDLRGALNRVVLETQRKTGATAEESEEIRRVVEGALILSLERTNENALLSLTTKSLQKTQAALRLFSLEIKRLGDTTTHAGADFGIAINNIIATIQGIKGGAVPEKDVFGRFRGTDQQFGLIEQLTPKGSAGAKGARQLKNLQNLEGQLPNILERTLKQARGVEEARRAEGGDIGEKRLTQAEVDKILKGQLQAVGGDLPGVVFEQIKSSIGGGARGGFATTADPVKRLEEILSAGAEDVEGFSGVITQGAEVADKAFEVMKKVFSDYAKVIQQGIALEQKTIQSRLHLLGQYDNAEDRLRTARGGRANITVEEARLRRTKRIQTTLGFDPGPDATNTSPRGLQGGGQALLALRQRLLAQQGGLERRLLAGPDERRRALDRLPPNDVKEISTGLVRNRASLERVNKALGILRGDTTELTAALNNLQQTVQRQIQAEQTIGTLADGVEALAKGDITPFEFQDRFGVPISAFEKLKEAVLTGRQDTVFGFDEVQALRKALTGGSPLLDAPLRALAERATSPGGAAFTDPRFKNDPEALLASLRADFTALAGKGALATLQGRQVGPQIITFLRDALGLQAGARQQAGRGGAKAIEVQRILREQRDLIEATGLSDQALFAVQMAIATRSFSQATEAFATAVASFELKVAPRPGADPGDPGGGGGPVGQNRGGIIKRFAKGGRVRGPSHAQGGVLAELEGGEYVIPKAMQDGGLNAPDRAGRLLASLETLGDLTRINDIKKQYETYANKYKKQTGDSLAGRQINVAFPSRDKRDSGPNIIGFGSGGGGNYSDKQLSLTAYTKKDGTIGFSTKVMPIDEKMKLLGSSKEFEGVKAFVSGEPSSRTQAGKIPTAVHFGTGESIRSFGAGTITTPGKIGYPTFVNEMSHFLSDPALKPDADQSYSGEKALKSRNEAIKRFREMHGSGVALQRAQSRAFGMKVISQDRQPLQKDKDIELYSDLMMQLLGSNPDSYDKDSSFVGPRQSSWSALKGALGEEGKVGLEGVRKLLLQSVTAGDVTRSMDSRGKTYPNIGRQKGGLAYLAPGGKPKVGKGAGPVRKLADFLMGIRPAPTKRIAFGSAEATGIKDPLHLVDELTQAAGGTPRRTFDPAPLLKGGRTASENVLGRAKGGPVYAKKGGIFGKGGFFSNMWAKLFGVKKMKPKKTGSVRARPQRTASSDTELEKAFEEFQATEPLIDDGGPTPEDLGLEFPAPDPSARPGTVGYTREAYEKIMGQENRGSFAKIMQDMVTFDTLAASKTGQFGRSQKDTEVEVLAYLLERGHSEKDVYDMFEMLQKGGRGRTIASGMEEQRVRESLLKIKRSKPEIQAKGSLEGMGRSAQTPSDSAQTAEFRMLQRFGIYKSGDEYKRLGGADVGNMLTQKQLQDRLDRGLPKYPAYMEGVFKDFPGRAVMLPPKAQNIIDAHFLETGKLPGDPLDYSKWTTGRRGHGLPRGGRVTLPPALGLEKGGPLYAQDGLSPEEMDLMRFQRASPETLRLMRENPNDPTLPFRHSFEQVVMPQLNKWVDPGPFGKPQLGYQDPFAIAKPKSDNKVRVRAAGDRHPRDEMDPRVILRGLVGGKLGADQYNAAWNIAQNIGEEGSIESERSANMLVALHFYDIRKQREKLKQQKKGRKTRTFFSEKRITKENPTGMVSDWLVGETIAEYSTRKLMEQWLANEDVDPVEPYLRMNPLALSTSGGQDAVAQLKKKKQKKSFPEIGIAIGQPGTHRRLWDEKGNRLMKGTDPDTSLLKGAEWVHIEARRKAVESQSFLQDYTPEQIAMAAETLLSIHPLTPDAMANWKKDFPSNVENMPYSVAGQRAYEHAVTPGSMNKLGKGVMRLTSDPGFGLLMDLIDLPVQAAAATFGGVTGGLGIRSGRAGTMIGEGKDPFFSGITDPDYVPRTWQQVYDDMLRGQEEAMFDPHWYEMLLFELADPFARGGLAYLAPGGKPKGLQPHGWRKGGKGKPGIVSQGMDWLFGVRGKRTKLGQKIRDVKARKLLEKKGDAGVRRPAAFHDPYYDLPVPDPGSAGPGFSVPADFYREGPTPFLDLFRAQLLNPDSPVHARAVANLVSLGLDPDDAVHALRGMSFDIPNHPIFPGSFAQAGFTDDPFKIQWNPQDLESLLNDIYRSHPAGTSPMQVAEGPLFNQIFNQVLRHEMEHAGSEMGVLQAESFMGLSKGQWFSRDPKAIKRVVIGYEGARRGSMEDFPWYKELEAKGLIDKYGDPVPTDLGPNMEKYWFTNPYFDMPSRDLSAIEGTPEHEIYKLLAGSPEKKANLEKIFQQRTRHVPGGLREGKSGPFWKWVGGSDAQARAGGLVTGDVQGETMAILAEMLGPHSKRWRHTSGVGRSRERWVKVKSGMGNTMQVPLGTAHSGTFGSKGLPLDQILKGFPDEGGISAFKNILSKEDFEYLEFLMETKRYNLGKLYSAQRAAGELGTPLRFDPRNVKSGPFNLPTDPADFNTGGLVYSQSGGSVFGNRHMFKPKGTDTIPAMLSQGEFVIRRDAVNAVGVDTLRDINSMGGGGGTRGLNRGGMVYAQDGTYTGRYTRSLRRRPLPEEERRPRTGVPAAPAAPGVPSEPYEMPGLPPMNLNLAGPGDGPSSAAPMGWDQFWGTAQPATSTLRHQMGWDIQSRGRRDRIASLTLPQLKRLKELVGPQNSVSNIDTLSDEQFEGIMKKMFAESKRAGLIAKGKTQVGDPTGTRYADATPAQRKARDTAAEKLRRRNLQTQLEMRFGRWAMEAGLFSAAWDDERGMIEDPAKVVAGWVRKWRGPPYAVALENRTLQEDKERDEKIHGRFVTPITAVGDERGVVAGARPGLFIRGASGEDRPRIRDVARPRGRGRFGVTGGQFRGAGTVAQGRAGAGVVGRRPGGMTTGRFDAISATRAEQARRDAKKDRQRTADSDRRVKKQKDRTDLEKLRIKLGLPAGATRDEILRAKSNEEYLKRKETGDLAPQEGIRRLSQYEIERANSPLYPKGVGGVAKLAGGGKFIDIEALAGYRDLRDEADYQQLLGTGMVLTDSFGQPGGPGIYVGRDAWAIAYTKAQIERMKRPRFKKVGGRTVKVRGAEEKRAHRTMVIERMKAKNAALLDPSVDPSTLSVAQQRRRGRLVAGQAKMKERNLKRLARINVTLARKFPDIPPFQPDAAGIPQGGWEAAQAVLAGNAIRVQNPSRGGYIRGYNTGGNVDSVKALLTPGEFVMRRESVRKYGERFMHDINLQKLNQGGSAGGPAGGGARVVRSQDLERGAALAGESILNAFVQGSQMVGDAIRQSLAPENFAAQLGEVVGQKMQESIAATSIEMKGNMGVDVRLSGNGATGDISSKLQEMIKNAIAEVLNRQTNIDGSLKDPSISDQRIV